MGFQVVFGKIYRRLDSRAELASPRVTLPSVQIEDTDNYTTSTEKVIMYVSNNPIKPTSVSTMILSDTLNANNIFGIQVAATWICFIKQNPSANLNAYIEGRLISDDDSFYNQ
jgi:hypothetical protein